MRRLVWTLSLIALLWPNLSAARVSRQVRYTKKQAYNAALRFVRVDQGFKITEKDEGSGYLLFEYPTSTGESTTSGSIEVIERDEEINLIIQLPKLPTYHEEHLANELLEKLKNDYGAPRAPVKPSPEAPIKPPSKGEEDQDGREPENPPSVGSDDRRVPRYRIR